MRVSVPESLARRPPSAPALPRPRPSALPTPDQPPRL